MLTPVRRLDARILVTELLPHPPARGRSRNDREPVVR
jgi:hypothetical protein